MKLNILKGSETLLSIKNYSKKNEAKILKPFIKQNVKSALINFKEGFCIADMNENNFEEVASEVEITLASE